MEKIIGIYARQSVSKETTGSIDDQIKAGKQLANSKNFQFKIYTDRGISGFGDYNKRPEFKRLLNDIEDDTIHAVFVLEESRLTRDESVKLLIKEIFCRKNIILYTALEGEVDYSNSDQELMSTIRTAIALKTVRDISKKISRVLLHRVEQGKAHGSVMKPYGYKSDEDKNLIIDNEEALVVNKIFNLYIEGNGYERIAQYLNNSNIPTRGNKSLSKISITDKVTKIPKTILSKEIKWSATTVRGIIKNSIYKGQRLYLKNFYHAPQIVSENDWQLAQDISNKRMNSHSPKKHEYLLNGIIKCKKCLNNLSGKTRLNKKDHFYYCMGKRKVDVKCKLRSINIDYLEEIIWYTVLDSNLPTREILNRIKLETSNEEYLSLETSIKSIENKIIKEKQRKTNLTRLLTDNRIDDDDFNIVSKEISDNIKHLQNDLNTLNSKLSLHYNNEIVKDRLVSFDEELIKWSKECDSNQKKALIRRLIEYILIDFDEKEKLYYIEIKTRIEVDGITLNTVVNENRKKLGTNEFEIFPPLILEQPMLH